MQLEESAIHQIALELCILLCSWKRRLKLISHCGQVVCLPIVVAQSDLDIRMVLVLLKDRNRYIATYANEHYYHVGCDIFSIHVVSCHHTVAIHVSYLSF